MHLEATFLEEKADKAGGAAASLLISPSTCEMKTPMHIYDFSENDKTLTPYNTSKFETPTKNPLSRWFSFFFWYFI